MPDSFIENLPEPRPAGSFNLFVQQEGAARGVTYERAYQGIHRMHVDLPAGTPGNLIQHADMVRENLRQTGIDPDRARILQTNPGRFSVELPEGAEGAHFERARQGAARVEAERVNFQSRLQADVPGVTGLHASETNFYIQTDTRPGVSPADIRQSLADRGIVTAPPDAHGSLRVDADALRTRMQSDAPLRLTPPPLEAQSALRQSLREAVPGIGDVAAGNGHFIVSRTSEFTQQSLSALQETGIDMSRVRVRDGNLIIPTDAVPSSLSAPARPAPAPEAHSRVTPVPEVPASPEAPTRPSTAFRDPPTGFQPEGASFLSTNQAGIARPGEGVRYLATDDTVGCITVVARNTVTGEVGMAHIMVDHSSGMPRNTREIYQPMIDGLRVDPSQPLEIRMFGGLHPEGQAATGQAFNEHIQRMAAETPNTNILSADIGSRPHPIGVVVDVQTGEMIRTGPLVSNYDQAIEAHTGRHTQASIQTDRIPRAAPAPMGDLPPDGLVMQPQRAGALNSEPPLHNSPAPHAAAPHTPTPQWRENPAMLARVQEAYAGAGTTGITDLREGPDGRVALRLQGELSPAQAAQRLGLPEERVAGALTIRDGHTSVALPQGELHQGLTELRAQQARTPAAPAADAPAPRVASAGPSVDDTVRIPPSAAPPAHAPGVDADATVRIRPASPPAVAAAAEGAERTAAVAGRAAGEAASHAAPTIGRAMGRVVQRAVVAIPFLGALMAGAEASERAVEAHEAMQRGDISAGQFAAVAGSVPAAAATGVGGFLTGEAGGEAIRAAQAAAGVPEHLRQGTLRTALQDLDTAIEAGREERGQRAAGVRQRIASGANGARRIEGFDEEERPTPRATETAAQAAARAAVAGMSTPVGGVEDVSPTQTPSAAQVARAQGHAREAETARG